MTSQRQLRLWNWYQSTAHMSFPLASKTFVISCTVSEILQQELQKSLISCSLLSFNPLIPTLKSQSNKQYSDWYTGHWWVGCYIWYCKKGPGQAGALPSPLLAVPNVTAHPSTASVPTLYYLMWHYNCLWTPKGSCYCSGWSALNCCMKFDLTKFKEFLGCPILKMTLIHRP